MLGFKNTLIIEQKSVEFGTVKQEVRVIDGSLFLCHWHPNREYWSYDQFCKALLDSYDFSVPKRKLLETVWNNFEDVALTLNSIQLGGEEVKECCGLTLRRK